MCIYVCEYVCIFAHAYVHVCVAKRKRAGERSCPDLDYLKYSISYKVKDNHSTIHRPRNAKYLMGMQGSSWKEEIDFVGGRGAAGDQSRRAQLGLGNIERLYWERLLE